MMTFFLAAFIASGAAFIIQTVLGLAGLSNDLETDGIDGIFGFLTIRNVITFILGFSSAGYLLLMNGHSLFLAVLIGVLFGLFLSGCVVFGMRLLMKLQQENAVLPDDYRDLFAVVIIRIGGGRKSRGKVELTIHGRLTEMIAVTDDDEEIVKGMQVQIVRQLENGALLVKKALIN